MVTFPAARHHHHLTVTKLYCLMTKAHVCEQLAQGCYLKARGRESNPRPLESQVGLPLTSSFGVEYSVELLIEYSSTR